ncbi:MULTISPECIES: TldD/PmbA family protein [unclassified Spirosoma]|uniref:TldD/PmbA family protein n=1 Tax=unclassified Spirosoma TaxID=2621999 RepID=UPI000959FFF0|nr:MULTISPECIES: TldD/PmbA family protein [unclassified Spirosoma]MBN8821151.1 TldD/PmbA family protein [Spirosoma sp.]OJW79217.1 MAG: peptidase C69 [Spirosoma sp. 48-14]
MAIISQEEAKKILEKVLTFSKADEMSVSLSGGRTSNIRYALNSVSSGGEADNMSLLITAGIGKRMGSATVNEFNDKAIERTVRRAEEIARLAPENPEYMPMIGPQSYLETPMYADTTAKMDAEARAQVAFDSVDACEQKNLSAAGFLQDTTGFSAIANSKGLFGYNKATSVDFSVTVRTADSTGSGYVTRDFNDISKLKTRAVTGIAMQKALASTNARTLEPGKYTVILEPTAMGTLLQSMMSGMDARLADEGRSFLSRKGGGTRLGEKLIDERITIYSDPMNPEAPSEPFASEGRNRTGSFLGGGVVGDGRPQEKLTWFENGVVKNMSYSRFWASQKGVKAVPPPTGFIMAGGNQSLADLIKSTDKGILVTRLWYVRMVDPKTLLQTGLTRDGTFYIENGQIKFPVKNFRFNESAIIVLNNVEALGAPMRVNGNLIPPVKARDFTFTSLSDAI